MGDNSLEYRTSAPFGIDLNKYIACEEVSEEERLLPIANVGNIMRKILPPTAKLSKEAKETMQECVSEFVSFLTSEASQKCRNENRKTLTSEDLIWAMTSLGLEDYAQALENYLQRYRRSKAEMKLFTEHHAFLDHSSSENNQRDAREDPQQYNFHISRQLREGTSSRNE